VRARFAFVPLVTLLSSCGSDDAEVPKRPAVSIAAGDWSVRVDLDAREIALVRKDGATLARLPTDGLALGARELVDDKTNYDPYPIFKPSGLNPTPEDLEWLVPSRYDLVSSTNAAIELDLSYPKGARARLKLETGKRPGAFRASLTPTGSNLAYFRVRTRSDSKEGFYGLGEYFDDVNHRGHVRAMQIELDGELESNYNEAHVPIPLLIGTRGWGLFVDDPHPGAFAVASEEPDRVDAVFGTGLATSKGLTFHLFGAAHPLDVTKHYYELTGYPLLPARWALGPWIWRDENVDQAQVENDWKTIRDLDLANTGVWIDRPYATAVNTFDFNAPQFPDPPRMIKLAHDLGMHVGLWHTPYLDEKDPNAKTLLDEARSKKFYPLESGLPLNKWGVPIDLTNKDAFAWWQALIGKYTDDLGIAGFKLDYGEDVVPGLSKARNVWRFSDGSDERTMHGGYTNFYHRAYAEKVPKEGAFLLCRHGTIGDQKYTSVIWPGDLDADFSKHREVVTAPDGKKYVSVGGLPASIIAGNSLGPSGYPFYGADTGGYRHSPPNKELFTRWFEQTALSTVMQVGNSANTVPWEADPKTGYDDEMLGWYRTYARLHVRLFPYEWTHAQNIAKTGRPIQRPLGLQYPELGAHPNDEYLFGDDLLVAPVVENGKRERSVIFPPGRWIDWWGGKVYEAGTTTVAAPLNVLPLFLREGGTVPMLRPTIDAIAPTTQPDKVDSYATTPGVLWVRVAPSSEATTFTVFDGAKIEQQKTGSSITIKTSDGAEFKSGMVIELASAKPTTVTEGGTAVPEADLGTADRGYSFADGMLRVRVPSGARTITIVLP
jgi:alpha-D-xyloside xylohydrolase